MSAPIITTEKATAIVGTLPSLAPRPSGTNIDALETDLINKLSGTPSYQSRDEGYGGMVEDPAIFALRCPTPWTWRKDPGAHRKIDPEWNKEGQADKQVEYDFEKGVYDSEQSILGSVITGLNAAVPAAYRKIKGGGIGTRMYRPSDDPLEIIRGLRKAYGRLTPTEKQTMETTWSLPWNTGNQLNCTFEASRKYLSFRQSIHQRTRWIR